MNWQTPATLLDQLTKNLKSAEEMSSLKTRAVKIRKIGLKSLVSAITSAHQKSSLKNSFKSKHLAGEFRPTEEDVQRYTERHILEPVSIGMVSEDWETLGPKLGASNTSLGYRLDEVFCDATELEGLGFWFHSATNNYSDIEFELLYSDIGLYSKTHAEASRINLSKFKHQAFVLNMFEHIALKELVAKRAEFDAGVGDYVKRRLDVVANTIINYCGMPSLEAEKHFRIMTQPVKDRVAAAVDAVAELEGPLLTPIMFSLGSTQEQIDNLHLVSPLKGLVYWKEYLGKDISQDQVRDILMQKGYGVN